MEHNLKIGDQIFVDIKRLGINGEGVAFYKRLSVFVPDALPKENVLVEITKVYNKYAEAKIIEQKTEAPFRVKPTCPYYTKCGACNLSHVLYQESGKIKRDMLMEALERYSGLNPRSFEIKDTVLSENPNNYRFKATLPLRQGEHGVVWGLYHPNSEKFIRIKDCQVHHPLINEIANQVCNVLTNENISAYDLKNKKGFVKYLIIRLSHYNLEASVSLILNELPKNIDDLGKKINDIENVSSVYYSINQEEDTQDFFGKEIIKIAGNDFITESIVSNKFELRPSSFFQINVLQAESLFETVKKLAKLSKKENIIDAYCGVGVIGIHLAKNANNVYGIENNKEAIISAKKNAKINEINNIKFIDGDVEKTISYLLKDKNQIDMIVLDPPRVGLTDQIKKIILNSNVKKIIYVSCNPSTLAKDLGVLKQKYNVSQMIPFDMFPQTSHVEAVCSLVKR